MVILQPIIHLNARRHPEDLTPLAHLLTGCRGVLEIESNESISFGEQARIIHVTDIA